MAIHPLHPRTALNTSLLLRLAPLVLSQSTTKACKICIGQAFPSCLAWFDRSVLAAVCRWSLGWAMIGLEFTSLAFYLVSTAAHACQVVRTAAWPDGFLWMQPTAEQRLANAAFRLMRCLQKVQALQT